MQNVSRLRLRAHTLNVETASWEDGYEGVYPPTQKYIELMQTLPDSSLAQPFERQQLNVQAVSDFLLQHTEKLFFFMSELLDLLLAGNRLIS
eukprot:1147194-Pelagomonas_calceolata.AAC.1